jgi:hypothetical protein
MTKTDIVMYWLLVGQVLCGLGSIVAVVIMFKRRAKERREKVERQTHG